MPQQYDAVVIGSGQGGTPLAGALAETGRRTALVEMQHVGGSCVNEGCTPTKTMVASARVAYLTKRAADYGVQTGRVKVDMQKVRERKRAIVNDFRDGSQKHLEKTDGLDLLFGEARFTAPKKIEVITSNGEALALSADSVFINAGARPAEPTIQGINDVPTLDSTSVMELDAVPKRLLVIGGGYVAIEFGQMFRRFGADVTIVQRGPQLLEREDPDVAQAVAEILREDGIEVLLNSETARLEPAKSSGIRAVIKTPNKTRRIAATHVLIATGRVPNTDALNLEAAGIEHDERGYINVNERLETSVPGVYALGDVKPGPAFTHISYDDFRIIRRNFIEGGNATTNGRCVPYTVFMDPQLGRVGLSEKEAREAGLNVKVAKLPMTHVARALETDETRGFMKAVVNAGSDQILGCAVLGLEGGEIMSVLQVAMMADLPYTAIKDGVFAHPTLAESLNNLFMTLDG